MKTLLIASMALALTLAQPLAAQDFSDYNATLTNEVNSTLQGIVGSTPQSGESVADTLSNAADTGSGILSNDYVGGVLGEGFKKAGAGVLGNLPISEGSAALGSYCGGDLKTAGDTMVGGAMGAVAGWSTATVLGEILGGAGVAIGGGITAPAWFVPAMAGATAAYITKKAYDWMLNPPASAPAASPTAPGPSTAPPTREKDGGDKDGGGKEGGGKCSC